MYAKLRQIFSLSVLTTAMCVGVAQAQTPAPPAPAAEAKPDYTITGNFGIYSQYVFRGLTQTDRKPAFQGGFDYANTNGIYLGTWGSNISWLHDAGVCNHGCSLEWDFYGGWKYAINDDWGTDIGGFIPTQEGYRINYSTSLAGLPIELNAGLIFPATPGVFVPLTFRYLHREAKFISGTTISVRDSGRIGPSGRASPRPRSTRIARPSSRARPPTPTAAGRFEPWARAEPSTARASRVASCQLRIATAASP